MEKNMRNRVALLGVLLVTGLVLAGIGTALGVGEVFQGIEKKISAVGIDDQVTIYKNGKVIQNFTLVEGGEYTWGTSDGAIHLFKMPKEEKERRQAEREAELNKWLEIAKKDGRVQELLEGKEYNVTSGGTDFRGGIDERKIDTAFLVLKIEGKYYGVTIDMNSETVKSVEEQSSGGTEILCRKEGAEEK